jgi:hypothetical protein
MQFSQFSRHLIPLRSKYPPQHPRKHIMACICKTERYYLRAKKIRSFRRQNLVSEPPYFK